MNAIQPTLSELQRGALDTLRKYIDEDPSWRNAALQFPVNSPVPLSQALWADYNLFPPEGIQELLKGDFSLELLEGESSPHIQGKPVFSCLQEGAQGGALCVSERPMPQFYREKRETLDSFVDFSYGGELPKWPMEIFLEISNICDFKCAMCPTFSAINPKRFSNLRKVDRGILEVSQASEPLEELLKHALIVHAFGYGEPTIHPNFREFVDYLSRYEVMIDFFSHGKHLSQDMCDFLVDRKISRVTISFSGSTAQDYENIYIGGKFQEVLDGLDRLNKAKKRAGSSFPQIHVNSIAFNHHIEKLDDFVHIMGRRGIEQVNIKPLSTYDSMPELHAHTSIMRKNIEGKILDKARLTGQQYGLNIESSTYERQGIEDDDLWGALESRHKGGAPISKDVIAVSSFKELAREKEQVIASEAQQQKSLEAVRKGREHYMPTKGAPCFEPFKTFYASFDGKVFPCCFKTSDAEPLGVLQGDSGAGIWNGEPFTEIKEKALENRYRADICKTCIRSNAYPHHHAVHGRFANYRRWFKESFNLRFDGNTVQRIQQLPDNVGILERRHRCQTQLPELKKALEAAGMDARDVHAETPLEQLVTSDPQCFTAAMRAFHPAAAGLTRKERARARFLSILPDPGRKTVAALLALAVAIGLCNVLIGSGMLALLELALIFSLAGVVGSRRFFERGRKDAPFNVDRFLSDLGQSPTP